MMNTKIDANTDTVEENNASQEIKQTTPKKRKRRIGDRREGRRLRTLDGLHVAMPFIMKDRNDACNTIWHIKLLHFSLIIILLSPLLILVLLTEGVVARLALYTSIAVCSLTLILFVKETFLLFRAQRFSIFHWFLYLCALEFFPLSLLLAPIVRG